MARLWGTIPLFSYIGTPFFQPVKVCEPNDQESRISPVIIDWQIYGGGISIQDLGIAVDFTGGVKPINRITSIYIDNTFSDVPIYVRFPDTQMVVTVTPGSVIYAPVITNALYAEIYALDFTIGTTPKTNIFFMNFYLPGLLMPSSFSPEPPPGILLEYTDTQTQTSTKSSFDFTVDIGEESADRLVVFSAWGYQETGNAATINVLTINGNTPTTLGQASADDGANNRVTGRAVQNIEATGTAAAVHVEFSGANVNACGVMVATLKQYDGAAPFDMDIGATGGGTSITNTIDTDDESISLNFAVGIPQGFSDMKSFQWSNATQISTAKLHTRARISAAYKEVETGQLSENTSISGTGGISNAPMYAAMFTGNWK